MRVGAQQINNGPMLVVGEPLRNGLGIVVDLSKGRAFPKWNLDSILIRGYWDKVTATTDEQENAIQLAKVEVNKPLLVPFQLSDTEV